MASRKAQRVGGATELGGRLGALWGGDPSDLRKTSQDARNAARAGGVRSHWSYVWNISIVAVDVRLSQRWIWGHGRDPVLPRVGGRSKLRRELRSSVSSLGSRSYLAS